MKTFRILLVVFLGCYSLLEGPLPMAPGGGSEITVDGEADKRSQAVRRLQEGENRPCPATMLEGEFMQMYEAGAKNQAKALGIELIVLGKQGDNEAEANFVYEAIDLGVDGIIIDHGLSETMVKPAADVLAKGIPVVAFDVDLKILRSTRSHRTTPRMGRISRSTLVKDFNGKALVGYTYVAGILPLDKRNVSWVKIKQANARIVEVAQTGTLDSPISVKNADQAKAVLQANPEIVAWLAMYDEIAKGIYMALEELNLTAKSVFTASTSPPRTSK